MAGDDSVSKAFILPSMRTSIQASELLQNSQEWWHVFIITVLGRWRQADACGPWTTTLTDDHQANERPCLKEVDGAPLRMISQVVLWYPHECTHMYIHKEAHVYLHTKVCTHAYMSTKALIGLGSCNLNFMFNFEVI